MNPRFSKPMLLRAILVIAVFAVLGVYFASRSSAGLSSSDVDKLNAVAVSLHDSGPAFSKGLTNCAGQINLDSCLSKLKHKFVTQISSSADTYEAVAANASGNCQSALLTGAKHLRVASAVFNGDSKAAPDQAFQRLINDQTLIAKACGLTLSKIKTGS